MSWLRNTAISGLALAAGLTSCSQPSKPNLSPYNNIGGTLIAREPNYTLRVESQYGNEDPQVTEKKFRTIEEVSEDGKSLVIKRITRWGPGFETTQEDPKTGIITEELRMKSMPLKRFKKEVDDKFKDYKNSIDKFSGQFD